MTSLGQSREHRSDTSVGKGGTVEGFEDMIMFGGYVCSSRWMIFQERDGATVILVYGRVSERSAGAAAASPSVLLRRWRRWWRLSGRKRLNVGQWREGWQVACHGHDEACAMRWHGGL